MKVAFAFLLLAVSAMGAIVSSYVDDQGRQIDHHVGSYVVKDSINALYRVTYDVNMLGGNLIVNLDQVKGVIGVMCDITNVELIIHFEDDALATAFYKIVSTTSTDRFVTSVKWNCNDVKDASHMLISRVFDAEVSGYTVKLKTAKGHYEEAIKDGTFDIRRIDDPECHDKTFCLGVNVLNEQCNSSKEVIPIIEGKYASVVCSECFIGAKATFFLQIQITLFKLRKISTGLKNINIAAAFVLDLTAQGTWSGNVDKTFKIISNAIIVQFWIGPIPISVWYEIPVQLKASADIDAKAFAKAGARANWNLGNAYFTWSEASGWSVVKPTPVFKWEHVLQGDANFNAHSKIQLIPEFHIHATRIAQAEFKFDPALMTEAHGDLQKKELCADLSYSLYAHAKAELHIDIPIIFVKYDKTFGPYEIINTGVQNIGHFCAK